MDTHGNPAAGGTANGMSESLFSGTSDIAPAAPENQPSDPAPAIDWDAIRVAVEDGSLSIREIARRHGVSDTAVRKKAKLEGWQGSQSSSQTAEAPAANPTPPPPQTKPQTDDTYEFSWRDHRESVVVPTQMGLAAYWNTDGKVVIRQQQDWDDYDDRMIFVSHQHVPALIRRLQAMLDGED
jgi:hypothetical protein